MQALATEDMIMIPSTLFCLKVIANSLTPLLKDMWYTLIAHDMRLNYLRKSLFLLSKSQSD